MHQSAQKKKKIGMETGRKQGERRQKWSRRGKKVNIETKISTK